MDNNLVFDIGLYDGNDTKHYLDMGYRVVAVEANPVLVENAKKRFKKHIEDGKLILLNVGISDQSGKNIDFWINDTNYEWSSFIKEIGCRSGTACHKIEIETIKTETLFEKFGIPFYFKVDIEGNDIYCINALKENELPKYFSCEVNNLELLTLLRDKGYTKFKMINQGDNYKEINIDKEKSKLNVWFVRIKRGIKNRTQHIIPYKYPHKTSGPFGENTKGKWKSYDEVKRLYLEFHQFELDKPLHYHAHFDFHATY